MSKQTRRIILAVLVLIFACFTQRIWMSELNFVVWKITYIGELVAFVVAPPNYDSAASVYIFNSVAIVVNAMVYSGVLWGLHWLLDRWRSKRTGRRAGARAS